MKTSADLAIVIVSWNVHDLLAKCLLSIEETIGLKENLTIEIYVVDNNSSDNTAEIITKNFPAVHLCALERNIGFGKGNNEALRKITSPYILLLNPDTVLLPGSIEKLLELLRNNEDVAMVGPKIVDSNGGLDHSCRRFPTMRAALHQFTILKNLFIFSGAHKRYMMKDFDYDKVADVDQIIGACMLLKREILDEVGLFDEGFYMFYEEVDLCFRIKEAGYRILFTPDAQIIHYADQSTQQIWGEMLFQKMKSLIYYFEKRGHKNSLRLFRPLLKIGLLLKLIKDIVEMAFKTAWNYLNIGNPKAKAKAAKYKHNLKENLLFLINHSKAIFLL